jgi:drug/metabolite transporter (DMT)-like permease
VGDRSAFRRITMTQLNRQHLIGLGWSMAAAALVTGYLVPYKIAAAEVGPDGLVFPMLLCAALINSLFDGAKQLSARGRALWRWDRTTAIVVLLLAVSSAFGNEATCRALVYVDPGLVSVGLRTQVIFVALAAMLVLGERVTLRFWIGVVVVLGGFLLLAWVRGLERGISMIGVAWAVAAAAGFGTMQIVVRRNVGHINHLQVNTLRLWLAVPIVLLVPGRVAVLPELDPRLWFLAAIAALHGPVLSRLCLMQALRHLPAAYATLALFVSPVFAYLVTGVVLGTWPGPFELAGGALILIGVALPILEVARQPVRSATQARAS